MDAIYEVHGLTKRYGRTAALNGVDFAVTPGKLVGLLGPNGSGKTTLMKISAGLLQPTAGSVIIDKVPVGVFTKAVTSYLPDEPLGGVDPAARDYILSTIMHNYSEDAALMLSTHLIGDIEKVLDEVILLQDGKVLRQAAVDELREETGESVDAYFREVYKC